MTNYYEDANGGFQVRPIEKAYFGNSIIYGNKEFEIIVDEHPDSPIPYVFDHCLIKADPEVFDLGDTEHFLNIINLEDPRFLDPDMNNFDLDTLSPAKDVALPALAIEYPLDINGESRLGQLGPDIAGVSTFLFRVNMHYLQSTILCLMVALMIYSTTNTKIS